MITGARGAQLSRRRAATCSRATARSARRCDFNGAQSARSTTWPASISPASTSACFPPARRSRASTRRRRRAAGCIVIDNTSEFRYDEDIPLVVPEVNPHAIGQYKNRGIIANPNCSTIQLRGGAEADPRRGGHRADQRGDVSVGLRGRAARRSRSWPTVRSAAQRQGAGGGARHAQADRLQLRAADRPVSRTTATPAKR